MLVIMMLIRLSFVCLLYSVRHTVPVPRKLTAVVKFLLIIYIGVHIPETTE